MESGAVQEVEMCVSFLQVHGRHGPSRLRKSKTSHNCKLESFHNYQSLFRQGMGVSIACVPEPVACR